MTQRAKIHRPVFVVGPHRSGTTLLYGILGRHPDVGYYNRANRKLRSFPRAAHFLTRLGVFGDDPMEAQRLWDRFRTGPDDVMDESHATDEVRSWYHRSIGTVLGLRRASRFVAKYPRLSMRLPWLDALFPDAIFVHVLRDWRAVVHSTVNRMVKRTNRGGGWFGVRIPGWQEMGGLPPALRAGRIYRVVTEALEAEGARHGDRYVRIRYENLCARPVATIRSLSDRCGWEWHEAFEASIPRTLRSANDKWRRGLDAETIEEIRSEAPGFFGRFETSGP
jgi:hypothetical protein